MKCMNKHPFVKNKMMRNRQVGKTMTTIAYIEFAEDLTKRIMGEFAHEPITHQTLEAVQLISLEAIDKLLYDHFCDPGFVLQKSDIVIDEDAELIMSDRVAAAITKLLIKGDEHANHTEDNKRK